jgi:hypothetical protein
LLCSFLRYCVAAGGRRRAAWQLNALEPLHSLVLPEDQDSALWLCPGPRNAFAPAQLALPILGEVTFQVLINFQCLSGVRDHPRDLIVVGIRDQQSSAQLALGLGELGRKDMARLRLAPLDLAGTSLGEALGRARVSLQFGHDFLVSFWNRPGVGSPNQFRTASAQGYPSRKADSTSIAQAEV